MADLDGSYLLPLDNQAIAYAKTPSNDAAAQLGRRLAERQTRLTYDSDHGYLLSLLEELDIPLSSQVLVFSKTSFQAPRISPRTPRAIYFNDTVAVGMVRGGDVLELSAYDPRLGAVFYTLDQERGVPKVTRRDDCLQCHQASGTLGVPGNVVRSVHPDHRGMPISQLGSFITDHRSPLKERWGGWYVTGTHGDQVHLGNVAPPPDADAAAGFDFTSGGNLSDLRWKFDTGAYPSPHSDIVALMVLEHQVRMQNLITRVNFETRMALAEQAALSAALGAPKDEFGTSTRRRIEGPAEYLVRYMLFTDEALLEGRIEGTSTFARDFRARGPEDAQGRSLRDFDLEKRLFRYPLSYMIYSEAFDALPEAARSFVYRRLWEVLSGRDDSPAFARLTTADRKALLKILRATKPGLPDYWKNR
ncbi:MAG: hypothetical protein ACK5AZ_23020 [Bryobacteraceae bacterium]